MGPIVDYLIVVPLDEEYDHIHEIVAKASLGRTKALPITVGPQLYSRSIIRTANGSASAVMLSVGRMTEAPFQAAIERSIELWRPAATILIGIAGSLQPDSLQLGDIIVPRKILGYAEAKAEAAEEGSRSAGGYRMVYRPTGHTVDCDLAAQARALRIGYRPAWQQACLRSVARDQVLRDRYPTTAGDLRKPEIHNHENDVLASGNVVVASKAFANELREVFGDAGRTIRAVEMEAKGFCEALDRARPKPQSLIVRGISDYADEAKASLEAESKDRWRRFAAQNAARFAVSFIVHRPEIEESYRPVALPSLRMAPDPESAHECMLERIDARAAGMRNVAFKPFLICPDGRPRLRLEMRAYDERDRATDIREVALRQAKGPELARERGISKFTHQLERSAAPMDLELFVGLTGDTRRLVAIGTDEFERRFECSCTFREAA